MKESNMKFTRLIIYFSFLIYFAGASKVVSQNEPQKSFIHETRVDYEARMAWWNEARFGLFIHWGLYAIPAGLWGGKSDYGEWIRTSAQIPIDVYDQFVNQFNPVGFNPVEWVKTAKDAGMKYIVITSKHHDGFCLFDSKYTDFDIMSTPFQRDIMKELAEASRKEGIKICWYYSIMDWHHPDYLPRREWEKNRTSEGADYNRYVEYMKNQLKELLTNYGEIGVLWFDGEWEGTWNQKRGLDLYNYVRGLQPDIIINNRVGAGRSGMEGFTKEGEFAGDYATPEQEIPATGIPGVYWETCMTMNDHWGYNKNDNNWKSTEDLIHKLVDIASKGGNFLLNVGPDAKGIIPEASKNRLYEIGQWMRINGESIYGTSASPFKDLKWGRCTQKSINGDTRLYLHVFDYPGDGKLKIEGIFNEAIQSFLLSDVNKNNLKVDRVEDALVISLPIKVPDKINSVVVLDLKGKPDVSDPPTIQADYQIFIDEMTVSISSQRENVEIRYTEDGSIPSISSPLVMGPVKINNTTTIMARCFRGGKAVSGSAQAVFTKVFPIPSVSIENITNGVNYTYYEGDWDSLPKFNSLVPVRSGKINNFEFSPRKDVEHFGFVYSCYLKIPVNGVYRFYTESDDGSQFFIGDELVVDNDGLHGMAEKSGAIALSAGFHPLRVTFFEKTGGDDLKVSYEGGGIKKTKIPDDVLFIKLDQ